jgi:hypothetical protein
MDENAVPIYTQCTGDDCGDKDVRAGSTVGRCSSLVNPKPSTLNPRPSKTKLKARLVPAFESEM